MNSELAQVIVLTAYGNAALHELLSSSDESFLREAPFLFQHVRTIEFRGREAQPPVAAVFEWFQDLRQSQVTRLWLTDLDLSGEVEPHIAEAFANSMPRGIAAVLDKGPIVFVPDWHFGRGQKWIVTYQAYELDDDSLPRPGDVAASLSRLEEKTAQARDFASRTDQEHWSQSFDEAIRAMRSAEPEMPYLPSRGYSSDARRLLAGAAAAWVFGGMGSWNDIWYQEKSLQAEYERVTREVYSAVSEGIVTAANAFRPSEERD